MGPIVCLPAAIALAGLLFPASAGAAGNKADAPVITNLKLDPSTAPRGSRILVHVEIFDRQGPGDVVPTLYFLREGWELLRVPVHDDGTRGDSVARDGFYTGEIRVPVSAAIGNHWFIVSVYDRSGHRSNLLIYEFWVSGGRQST
jgi:hypothetical protein